PNVAWTDNQGLAVQRVRSAPVRDAADPLLLLRLLPIARGRGGRALLGQALGHPLAHLLGLADRLRRPELEGSRLLRAPGAAQLPSGDSRPESRRARRIQLRRQSREARALSAQLRLPGSQFSR